MDHLLSITKIFKLLQWRCLRPATSYLKLVLAIYLFGKRIDITLVEIENFKYRKKNPALCGKCPNAELFLVRIFLYLVRIQENTDHEKLRILTRLTQ